MYTVMVSSEGQITIPDEVRRKLNLQEGDEISFLEEYGKVVLVNSSNTSHSESQHVNKVDVEKGSLYSNDDVVNTLGEIKKDLW